jgi:hypothetical protein
VSPVKLLAHVYAYPGSVHRHLHTSPSTLPSERPAEGSLRSDSDRRSLLAVGASIEAEGLFLSRAISSGKHPRAILGLDGRHRGYVPGQHR